MMSVKTSLSVAALAVTSAAAGVVPVVAQNWRYSWRVLVGAPVRDGGSLVFDEAHRSVVIYGGTDQFGGVPDRRDWVVLGEGTPRFMQLSWRTVDTDGQDEPGWRRGHSAVYDSRRGRMLVFGGWDASGGLAEGTFALDLAANGAGTWSRIDASGGPSPRWGHRAVYDEASDVMVVFGGHALRGDENDLWVLDFDPELQWRQLVPANSPAARYWHSMSAGAADAPILVYGGVSGCTVYGDLWALDLDEDAQNAGWRELRSTGSRSPGPRFGHAAGLLGYDLYVVGGQDGSYAYDVGEITWVLYTAPLLRGMDSKWQTDPTFGGPTGKRRGASLTWMNGMFPGWSFTLFGGSPMKASDTNESAAWTYLIPGDPLPPADFTPPAATDTPVRPVYTSLPPASEACPTQIAPTPTPPTRIFLPHNATGRPS